MGTVQQAVDAFQELYRHAAAVQRGIPTYTVDLLRQRLGDVEACMSTIRGNPILMEAFFDSGVPFYATYNLLIEIASSNPPLRSGTDRLFNGVLGGRWRRAPRLLTRLFGEFIKGITYFAPESGETPAYHRIASCGDGAEAFRNARTRCPPEENKRQSKTCLLERIVYDKMYVNMFVNDPISFGSTGNVAPMQDAGHIEAIRRADLDFQTCHPRGALAIDLEYDDSNTMPHILRVTFLEKDGDDHWVPQSLTTYERPVIVSIDPGHPQRTYGDVAFCHRVTKTGQRFAKMQSFHGGEGQWVRESGNAAALSPRFESNAAFFAPYRDIGDTRDRSRRTRAPNADVQSSFQEEMQTRSRPPNVAHHGSTDSHWNQ